MTTCSTTSPRRLGAGAVLTDSADVAAYVIDWRGAYRGRRLRVVRPASTGGGGRRRTPRATTRASAIVPQGGNTGLSGGAVPDTSGDQVVLSLGRMRGCATSTRPADMITVEAGVVLADVQAAAAAAGRLFPMSLGSEGQLHDRRQPRHQRRRHRGAALRHDPRAGARPRGRARRRPGVGRAAARCARTTPATTSPSSSSAPRARSASSPRRSLRLFPATPRHATAWLAVPSTSPPRSRCSPVLRTHAGDCTSRPSRSSTGRRSTSCSRTCPAPATRSASGTRGTRWSSSPAAPPTTVSTARSRRRSARRSRTDSSLTPSIAGSPAQRVGAVGAARGHLGGAERRGRDAQARRHPPDRLRLAAVDRHGVRGSRRSCPACGWSPTATSATATSTTTSPLLSGRSDDDLLAAADDLADGDLRRRRRSAAAPSVPSTASARPRRRQRRRTSPRSRST